MPRDQHVTDPLVENLTGILERGTRRLEQTINTGLRRGLDPSRIGTAGQVRGDATVAYRARQKQQADAILAELRMDVSRRVPLMVKRAYVTGVVAVDRTIDDHALKGTFGGLHVRALETIAGNLTGSLHAALDRTGANVAKVFERADRLEAGLPVDGVHGFGFIGRRVDDPWRTAALEEVGQGVVGLATRPQVSRDLADRLIREGTTDALTGFVSRDGRRLPLEHYARMVARTTTREAMSRGTVNRLREADHDLVTITSHPHQADECSGYDGRTFSLDGLTPGYDVLDQLPPFHPNCLHVVTPALANLDRFENELAGAGAQSLGDPAYSLPPKVRQELKLEPPAAPPAPPFTKRARPAINARTAEDLEAQRVAHAIERDPGPEPGAEEAWAKAAVARDRANNRALNKALGPDLAKFIDRKWGQEAGIRRQLLDGELTVEEAGDLAYEEYNRIEGRRALREDRERESGFKTGQFPCFVCGRFKRRPADICEHCGDDPVTGMDYVAGSMSIRDAKAVREFNRVYGYSG